MFVKGSGGGGGNGRWGGVIDCSNRRDLGVILREALLFEEIRGVY